MNWISHPVNISGKSLNLVPLEEKHFDELLKLSKDKKIWEYYPYDLMDTSVFIDSLKVALAEREKGSQYPFVIVLKSGDRIIGGTRFLDIQPAHRKLEIGYTWLHPEHWGSGINLECKLLLLTYSFETLHASRVQLKTDEINLRSRKAILKIGGTFEGILRNDMIRYNQTKRNSAYFSFIEEEWPEKKIQLEELCLNTRMRAGI